MKNSYTDIIVPVYNAYDAVVECVNSLIENTDLVNNRLILIDDCSPDKRIRPLLKGFKSNYTGLNIEVLENEINLGFVGTVNRGMKFSQNDVLLLNSDTQVSKDWIVKIKNCAYSDESIGSVTPLSNNATLVSVPKGLQRNEPLENISLEEYNTLIENCSYKEYPELPTAHGFCMFIKREVLNIVGFFDERSFEKGYGEENDFSFRLLDYGYKNVLCDDTLVYHKESQSFSNVRNKVLEDHLKIIRNRYPQYIGLIDNWCIKFPIKHICENIDMNISLHRRKNVLLVVHEFEGTLGGTTLHILDIIKHLNSEINFHVLYPFADRYVLHSFFENEDKKTILPYIVNHYSAFQRYNSKYRLMIEDIIRAFSIDTLHVHHMINHYFDIVDIAKSMGVYSVITLHDYYCVCHNQNLLFCNEKYCGAMTNPDCKKCLSYTHRASNDITKKWRTDWNVFLQKFDRVIVPSHDTKVNITKYYNNINIEVVEHGLQLSGSNYTPSLNATFNIAFIGVMCKHKGGDIINRVINKCADPNIHFNVFGKSELPELEISRKNYTFHGAYDRDDLANLLHKNNINLICFLQLWPETYSYTLNEAINAKIPVLTTNIGAGKDRVYEYGLGWIVNSFNPEEILQKIYFIKKNDQEYKSVLKKIHEYKHKTVKFMANEYADIYKNGQLRKPNYKVLSEIIKASIDQSFDPVVGNNQAAEELFKITHSIKWRILGKIKVPKPIKSTLRFFYKVFIKLRRE